MREEGSPLNVLGVEWVTSPLLAQVPRVRHGFTTRRNGTSRAPYDSLNIGLHVGDAPDAVIENRRRACQALGFTLADWVSGEQVHGAHTCAVGPEHRGRGSVRHDDAIPQADGLATAAPGVLLAGYFADCVPVLVVDPHGPRVGLAHAGWRGTLAGVAGSLVRTMSEAFGSRPDELLAWLGPAIGPCCFTVGPDVAGRFREAGLGACVADDGRRIDLRAANRELLLRAGLRAGRIDVSDACTACCTDRFFSHRAEGPRTGRMAALIGIARAGEEDLRGAEEKS